MYMPPLSSALLHSPLLHSPGLALWLSAARMYLIMPEQWTLLGLCLPTSISSTVVEPRLSNPEPKLEFPQWISVGSKSSIQTVISLVRFAPTPGETAIHYSWRSSGIIDSFTKRDRNGWSSAICIIRATSSAANAHVTFLVLILLWTWPLAFSESEQWRRIERYLCPMEICTYCTVHMYVWTMEHSSSSVTISDLAGHPKKDAVFPIPISPIQAFVDLVVEILVSLSAIHSP